MMLPMQQVVSGNLRLGSKITTISFTASTGLHDEYPATTYTNTWDDPTFVGFYGISDKPSVAPVAISFNSSARFRIVYYNSSSSSAATGMDVYPMYAG